LQTFIVLTRFSKFWTNALKRWCPSLLSIAIWEGFFFHSSFIYRFKWRQWWSVRYDKRYFSGRCTSCCGYMLCVKKFQKLDKRTVCQYYAKGLLYGLPMFMQIKHETYSRRIPRSKITRIEIKDSKLTIAFR